jgi:hypothetical protein
MDRIFLLTDLLALSLAYAVALHMRFSSTVGPAVYGFINGLMGWGRAADLYGTMQHLGYATHAYRYIGMLGAALLFIYALQGMYH